MSARCASARGSFRKKNGGIWFIVELATSMGIWSGPRKNAARAAHREQPSKRGCYKASRWSEGSVVAHGFGLGGFVSTGQGSSQGLVSALAWPWPLGVRQRWHGLGGQALWLMQASRSVKGRWVKDCGVNLLCQPLHPLIQTLLSPTCPSLSWSAQVATKASKTILVYQCIY